MVPRKTLVSGNFGMISEAFSIRLEVSVFHGLLLLFLSFETFHQRVSAQISN